MDIKSMKGLPKDFVIYLTEHPNYLDVLFSSEKMDIIESLKLNAKFFPQILQEFSNISEERLELILNFLVEIHIVEKIVLDKGFMFFVSTEGLDFLERVEKLKKEFSL